MKVTNSNLSDNSQQLTLRKGSTGEIAQASNKESANAIYQSLNSKEGRFARYKKAIKGSVFLGGMLNTVNEKEQIKLIDAECDIIINQISAKTGIQFDAIADTILVEDFSYIDDKGKLHSSFSSQSSDDMRYLFASCLTRLSSIIKRQVAGNQSSAEIVVVNDIMWTKYKSFKSNELTRGRDMFAGFLPEAIRRNI